MSYPFSCLFVSPVSFPFLIFIISFPETQRLAGRSMGTRGRLLLVPTHCLGFLGCQWWPDPRDLLRSRALTKTYSLLVLICRVGGRTCEIYPVALCISRNCGSGGCLGGPSHAVVLHQHFYHLKYVAWYRVPQSYLLVHRIAHWSQVAVLYGCVKFLVSGCRCHR